jgi:asparagine synthase (glutamine-hydrolysing)
MCGIAGVICSNEYAARLALRAMSRAQTHRGPDGAGEILQRFGAHTLGLGHRRLSIIDLSAQGAQPMVHPQTGDVLVYNGELYNHHTLRSELVQRGVRFRGHSDSEVLLHALAEWGTDAVNRLEGMFAFAFYRVSSSELLLARDPLGIKPLYVGRRGRAMVFASEARAIVASGLVDTNIDRRGIAGLLAYGACQHPFTMFESVRSFPPGSWQIFTPEEQERSSVRYWKPPAARTNADLPEISDFIRRSIDRAVRDHLVSDVPVGVFLSSGLDSTIVAGLAARHAPGLRSFTVGFAENPDLSELTLAARTAKVFGLDHTEVRIESADALAAVDAWLGAIDLPSIDGLNVFIISRAVRQRGITVALSGQGGDELFGGYSTFTDVPRLHRLMKMMSWLPKSQRRHLAMLVSSGRTAAFRAKAISIAESGGDLLSLYTRRRQLMSARQLAEFGLFASELGLDEHFLHPAEAEALAADPRDLIWSVGLQECSLYLGNMLLRDGDANSMAHSLEIRVPLLDRKLLDLVFALSGETRLPQGRANKHLLRSAFPDLLREELLHQSKRGFTLPIRRWMLGPLREVCRAGLEQLRTSGVVDPRAIDNVWSSFISEPESPAWSRAFACCVLGRHLGQSAPVAQRVDLAS